MVGIFYFCFPVRWVLIPKHFYPEGGRNVRLNCPSSILDNLDRASKVWNVTPRLNKLKEKWVKVLLNAYKNHSRGWKLFSSTSKTCLCIFCTLLLGLFWALQWLKAPQQVLGWNFGGSEDERWALLWVELGQTAFQEPFPALTKQLGTEEKRFRNSNYLCGNCRELVRRRRWGVPVEWRDGFIPGVWIFAAGRSGSHSRTL